MKLSSRVLQEGGTGPRFFRVAYGDCITEWKAQGLLDLVGFTVEHNEAFHQPGIAAYADDLARVATGDSLQALQDQDAQSREALQQLLAPRGAQLNESKGGTLLIDYKTAKTAQVLGRDGQERLFPIIVKSKSR